jgi:metallo-beta-lactamase class B
MRFKYLLVLLILFLYSLTNGQIVGIHDTIHVGSYITIQPMNAHLYRYVCSNFQVPSNGLIYVDKGEAILIDAPEGENITGSLLDWIRKGLGATIKGVIITHWHGQDRMGGIDAVNSQNIPSYCSNLTMKIAIEKGLPHPLNGFDDSLVVMVGDKSVICKFPGAGHTADNIVVWFLDEKVLFGGCLVKDMTAQNLGYTADADINAWPVSVQNVIAMFPDAEIVVPGHFNYGGKELLYHTLELLKKQSGQK